MAQADLECYDEAGNVTLTAATLFGRVMGTFATGTADGSRYFAGLTSAGADAWFMSAPPSGVQICVLPIFTIANDNISWRFVDFTNEQGVPAPRQSVNVIVGTS